jgi:hypothetical protein
MVESRTLGEAADYLNSVLGVAPTTVLASAGPAATASRTSLAWRFGMEDPPVAHDQDTHEAGSVNGV